jgi:hypothetical protein
MFADRIVLVGPSNTVSGDVAGATLEPGDPNYWKSLWWSWTAPSYGEVSLAIVDDSHIRVSVFTGDSLTNLALISSGFNFHGVAGVTYQIALTGTESSGAFTLTVSQPPPPAAFQIYAQLRTVLDMLGGRSDLVWAWRECRPCFSSGVRTG